MQLFTYSGHLCPGQVAWLQGKGEPCCLNTSFWTKVWQRLSWWSWTLLCGVALAGRAQGGASGHRASPCCLTGAALPAPADGLPSSAQVLWPQALERAICSGISSLALFPVLVALAGSGAAFHCTTSFAAWGIYDVSYGDTLFFFPTPKTL